jgi:predicted transcriptional regulator
MGAESAVGRKKSSNLTDAELRLMEVVWEKGKATVAEVVEGLPPGVLLAYSTVLTTLRILENKGYLRHTKDGRSFVYHPVVKREQARDSALIYLLRRFFEDSPELLMLNLMKRGEIDGRQLARLRRRLEEDQS